MNSQLTSTDELNLSDLKREDFAFESGNREDLDKIHGESLTFWKDVWKRIITNKVALFCIICMLIFAATAIIVPFVARHTYDEQILPRKTYLKLPPRIPGIEKLGMFDGKDSSGVDVYAERGIKDEYFYFGTDDLARDIWSRCWYGVRISLYIGLLSAVVNLVVGVAYGGIAGFYGGQVDALMMRFTEIIGGIPDLVVLILFLLIFEPGIFTMSLALVMTSWIGMARITRAQVLKIKEQEFIMSATTLGAKSYQIILKHMLPNIIPTVVVVLTFSIPNAIFYEAFLAFIGLGIPAPAASLGVLINDGYALLRSYPYMMLIPTVILSCLMLFLNLFANGLRDAVDPTMRNK